MKYILITIFVSTFHVSFCQTDRLVLSLDSCMASRGYVVDTLPKAYIEKRASDLLKYFYKSTVFEKLQKPVITRYLNKQVMDAYYQKATDKTKTLVPPNDGVFVIGFKLSDEQKKALFQEMMVKYQKAPFNSCHFIFIRKDYLFVTFYMDFGQHIRKGDLGAIMDVFKSTYPGYKIYHVVEEF